MAGRRTKQTDARVAMLLNALKAGNTRSAAAAYAEIDRATFYRWLDADASFRDSVEKAEADAEVRFASQVAKAATDGTWQAAAWWLERRHPGEYGRRERVDVNMDIRSVLERLSPDPIEREAAFAEVSRILAESRR